MTRITADFGIYEDCSWFHSTPRAGGFLASKALCAGVSSTISGVKNAVS